MDELSSVENKSNLLYIDRGLSSLMSAKNVSGGNSSSSESACSINFLPLLPKSSSGHSSASTESSSSSSTSSAAAVAVVMSAAMNNSSSSSSSSPSPPKSPLKHNNHHNHQSQMNSPFILNAFVNGFVQLKLCADKIDYAYIIEIYWSNESRSFVKRTFDDFVEFHARFLTEFADFFSSSTSSADSRTSPLHHISPTVQRKKPPPPPLNDSKSKFFNFAAKPMFELIPVLPVAKKRFWMSQLKLAESREIELNNYVQHLLKLPTNISHSGVVIKFFESQSSDPKPAGSYFHKSEVNDYEEERDDFDDDEDEVNSSSLNNSNYADDELTRCQQRISSISNHNSSSSSDEDENDDENDDEDDDDDDDDRPHINLPHSAILSSDYSGRLSALSSSHYSTGGGLRNLRKKSSNKQSSLWWDEDNALNELTTSISTEFGSQFNLNNNNSNNQKFGYKIECDEATTTTCKLEDDEEEEDIQTLKTLDNMIKTSELFNDETPSSN